MFFLLNKRKITNKHLWESNDTFLWSYCDALKRLSFICFQAFVETARSVFVSRRGPFTDLSARTWIPAAAAAATEEQRASLLYSNDGRQTERDGRGRLRRDVHRVLYLFRQKTTKRSKLQKQTA